MSATHPFPRPKKRLIVCCDGTWQASDKTYGTSPSNIAKLSRMIAHEDGDIPQVVYYQSGVGTGSKGLIDITITGSLGIGLSENVSSAYHYLSTNFHAKNDSNFSNDEIFLFGFSRGAYTARVLSGLVTEMGLLKPQHLHEFPRAFEIYKTLSSKASKKINKDKSLSRKAAKKAKNEELFLQWTDSVVGSLPTSDREFWHGLSTKTYGNVKIKAVGVWDTVGALGIPQSWLSEIIPGLNQRHQFHNTGLNTRIENAFQALALDEHRGAFPPTLWYLPEDLIGHPDCPNLKQCWFPGYHESIGGGGVKLQYDLASWFPYLMNLVMPDTSQMHEVTLAWMCDQVNGLLKFDRAATQDILLKNGRTRPDWAACKEIDMLTVLKFFKLKCFGDSRTRKPGQYFECHTNETMHPSVYFRTNEVKRLHYTGRPLRERFVWVYCAWLPQFHLNVATLVSLLTQTFRLLSVILFYAGTPIRILTPSLWELLRDLWNVGGGLIHLVAASIAHVGRHLQRFPFAFGYLDEPLWTWQERSTDLHKADGATWVRRKVPWSVMLQNGQEEVHLQEWVIRESPERDINFEKEMLPVKVWNKLNARNSGSIKQAERYPDYRTQFWTRTDWEHRHDKFPSHRPVDQHLTILHPLCALYNNIQHAFGTAQNVHKTIHRIEDKVHHDIRNFPHKFHDTLDKKADLMHQRFHNAIGVAHHAVDRAHDGIEGIHDRTHEHLNHLHHGIEGMHDHTYQMFAELHDSRDHSHLGKKNKKHKGNKGMSGEDENLNNGGAVQHVY